MVQYNESVVKNLNDYNNVVNKRPKSPVFTNPLFEKSSGDSSGVTVNDLKNSKEPPASVKNSIATKEKKDTVNKEQSGLLSKVAKHFNLAGTENGVTFEKKENKKISSLLSTVKSGFETITKNKGKMENLKSEAKVLASAQNALDEIDKVPKKEELMKKLEQKEETKEEANKIFKKIQGLNLLNSLSDTVDTNGIQNMIEKNHSKQSNHIDQELKLLEKFKKLTGIANITGKDKENKKVLSEKISDNVSKKISDKKDEKETKRKKHWWERIFFHNNKKGDKHNTVVNSEKPRGILKKLKMDLNSPELQFFVYFSFIAITIFTITLFTAYNNKKIYEDNTKLMKQSQGLYLFGLAILIIFLLSLSLSFGHDKDFKQKIGSFVLLNGTIYMGSIYTYLESNNSFKGLSKGENMISQIVVAFFILFLLTSVAYVLSEKRKGKIGRIFGFLYLASCFIGFFPLGGAVTSFNARLKVPKGEKESLLVPLCTVFFGIGIFLFISAVIDAIPPLNKAVSKGFNSIFKVLEPSRIKFLIVSGLVMSIYYSYALYKVYNSKYISGDGTNKFPDKKNDGINKTIKTSYTLGLGLIASVIFCLSLSFGGTLKEQGSAILLTFFVIICGSYITYLEGEGKINEADAEEKSMTTATIAIFMVLLVACILFTVFGNKSGTEVLIKDSLRIGSNFGSIILFFYMFGITTAVAFQEFLSHNSGTIEGKYMWAGFGIGLTIIILFIASFFV